MRTRAHAKAGKQTVSLTVDRAVYAAAKALGINASHVAEQALAAEVARREREQIRREIAQELDAIEVYEKKYGSFTEAVREHHGLWRDAD
jgi:post-segregation antitoxin (ccd killing protein)